jgi:Raf kinase inhibitor-like YbhB/YbcL family protein
MVRLLAAAGVVLASTIGAMQMRSAEFSDGGVIPTRAMALGCGGENRSPQLAWTGVPRATKSLALIVHDPDAPIPGGFYHWVVYNLPPAMRELSAGAKLAEQQIGATSAGTAAYYGPCPPPGPMHHYVFTLYALDIAHISADAPLTATQLQARIAGHVLARGLLRGTETHH